MSSIDFDFDSDDYLSEKRRTFFPFCFHLESWRLYSAWHVQICTLRKPSRDAWAGDVSVPEDAPQEIVDLIGVCRSEEPKDRPTIAEVCQIVNNLNFKTALSGPALTYATQIAHQVSCGSRAPESSVVSRGTDRHS